MRESRSPEPWTPAIAEQLAKRACLGADLRPSGFVLLRFGTNAVFQVTGTPWVLRLRRPGVDLPSVQRQVALARWLVDRGFPANRPAEHHAIVSAGLDGAVASFWERLEADPAKKISAADFGRLLHTFHALTNDYTCASSFPQWDAVGEIMTRLSTFSESEHFVSGEEIDLLTHWTQDIADSLNKIDWILPPGMIHGDAHTGNVLVTSVGAVLIDFDALALGPREWDLVPTAVSQIRFCAQIDPIDVFAKAYGFDLLAWSGWGVLRKLRELYMLTWLLSVAVTPERQNEARRRLESLRQPSAIDMIWHAV
jgi:Ser/Thr protein kinase RdoA (MazF antagonist)